MKKLLVFLFLYVGCISISHGLTLEEIRDQVRIRIADTNSSLQRYTDAQLNTFINESHRDVINATWVILRSTSVELSVGATYYTLPDDLIDIERVTFKNIPLKEFSMQGQDGKTSSAWEASGGTPSQYFQNPTRPGELGVYPYPSSVSSTGTIRIQYYAQGADLSDDDDVPFDEQNRYLPYHDTLVLYTCYKIFLLEGEIQKAQLYIQEYESRLLLMRDRVRSHPNWTPGFSGNRGP